MNRNKINNQITDHPFTDYWDIFVLKHQHPINITLHIAGIIFFYSLIITTYLQHNPWLLIGLPITQIIGLIGHILFERSHIDIQDAIFTWRASRCLGKMLFRVLQGKYKEDIHQRLLIIEKFQQ